ncbi:sugar ABC transporter ATP-binding protein [Alicyclobacillaceae bacterium I2511]|jgi:ABC-type sugar transport system ATPase subunit|nr:sugar ABC transporter ATP-binding protein [Alicyclobacillaceae bacterium I2511]
MDSGPVKDNFIRVENLSKSYSGVTVLHDFSLVIRPGEVHALIGHNGAGKSTVIRMLSGSEAPTAGEIILDGQPVNLTSPRIARHLGIYTVFQELRLIDELTVSQNIFLGKELSSKGFSNKKKMNDLALTLLKGHNLSHIDVTAKLKSLSHAERQLIEIMSCITNDARLILLDEPTTALQSKEVQDLMNTIRELSQKNISFLFITHKIEEAFSVCTHVTVLRNGQMISSKSIAETNQNEVFEYVAGHKIVEVNSWKRNSGNALEVVLEVKNLKSDVLEIDSLRVKRGEVIGLYGLVGSGRTELLETLYGARPHTSGNMSLVGKPYHPKSPSVAVRSGVFLLTEERKINGIIPQLNSKMNMIIASVDKFQKFNFLRNHEVDQQTMKFVERLSIKGDMREPIVRMSGGNQQKVMLARWLIPNGQVLMLDEPTKGVDIGVKAEIHAIIRDLAKQNYAILVVSSEVEEIVAVSDIVAVMQGGRIKTMLEDNDITENRLLAESMEGTQK